MPGPPGPLQLPPTNRLKVDVALELSISPLAHTQPHVVVAKLAYDEQLDAFAVTALEICCWSSDCSEARLPEKPMLLGCSLVAVTREGMTMRCLAARVLGISAKNSYL